MSMLCPELLQEIFLHASTCYWFDRSHTYARNVNQFTSSPCWAISQTCHRWRSISLSVSRLWTDLILHLDGDECVQEYPIHKIFLLLQRSKKAGLRIHFRLASVSKRQTRSSGVGERYALELLDIFVRHSARWRSFELLVAGEDAMSFLDSRHWRTNGHLVAYAGLQREVLGERLFVGSFPRLEVLKVSTVAQQGGEEARANKKKKKRARNADIVLRVDIRDARVLKEVCVEKSICSDVKIWNETGGMNGGAIVGGRDAVWFPKILIQLKGNLKYYGAIIRYEPPQLRCH
ncbi:hypothetical protein DL96DRAFT_1552337 [Flagelloscypha sp. PMI_526]|nr:hypothetical protein DL96DRAFT_1552337 [Flagelloscypha sp. PMI_526]